MRASNWIADECLIWPGHKGTAYTSAGNGYFVEHSSRAGGSYSLSMAAKWFLDDLDAPTKEKIATKITTWLVDQRRLGNPWPTVTTVVIEEAKAARDLTADERAERLLRFLAQQTPNLGNQVRVAMVEEEYSVDPYYYATAYYIAYQAMAISESTTFHELSYLSEYLRSVGWIELANLGDGTAGCTVTVHGHRQIAIQEINPSSDQVFVAMWFDDCMVDARENGIKPAILNTGYTPRLIDEKPESARSQD